MPRDCAIRIRREDQELLVIREPLALARAFFRSDPSSVGGSAFDQLAGKGEQNAIVLRDVIAINTTMRARSSHRSWITVIEGDAAWLAAIPLDLDLLDHDDDQWRAAQGDEHLRAGLTAVVGPGRGVAVATKVLHLKRPRLFPVLDSLVAQMFDVNDPMPAQRIDVALELARAVRREGRRNIEVLRCVKQKLHDEGIHRPLARILDALVWLSHPAAGLLGTKRVMEVSLDPG